MMKNINDFFIAADPPGEIFSKKLPWQDIALTFIFRAML